MALAFAAGALILLLIAGTQVLDWYWPVLVFGATLAYGFWRIRQRSLSEYALAQIVDQRLSLSDRISTVVYFEAQGRPETLHTVERQALEQLKAGDLERAVPISRPRAATYAAGLAAVALAIVGVRYGVLHTLSLSQPLAHFESATVPEPVAEAKSTKSAIQERFEQQLKQLGISVEDLEAPGIKAEKGQETTMSAINSPEGQGTGIEKGQEAGGTKGTPDNQEGGEGGEKSDDAQGPEGGAKSDESGGKESKDGKSQSQPPGSKPGGNGANQDSSLMAKMKDALSNLMNKMGSQGQKGDDKQGSAQAQSPSQGKGQQQPGQKGTQGQSKNAEGQPSPDQQGDKDSEGSEKMAGSQSKAGDKNADRPGSQDAKSGMGKQDGAKEIHEAEQLAAMGKISEIFGKRAAQINGEMTVEVPAGKQQLKTAYTGRRAAHADTSGESNRNEIPLQYQTYVQRYFEEVRKQPAPKAKAQ